MTPAARILALCAALATSGCAGLTRGEASAIEGLVGAGCAGLALVPIPGVGGLLAGLCTSLEPAERAEVEAAVTHAAATTPAPTPPPRPAPAPGTRVPLEATHVALYRWRGAGAARRRVVVAIVPAHLAAAAQVALDRGAP